MRDRIAIVAARMIAYNGADFRRISHALTVYGLVKAMAEEEGLDDPSRELLEAAALLHDIGIKLSEQKYGVSTGRYQQIEGPPVARELLQGLGFLPETVERICYLIAHHHTYTEVTGTDYQLLIEADFLVNLQKEGGTPAQVALVGQRHFKTEAGRRLLASIYPVHGAGGA